MAELENELGTPVDDLPPPVELSEEERATEEQARRMGWRPKEEFDRPPERWVDAKTFVERGMTELPLLRDRYRKLDRQMAEQTEKLTATERTLTETRDVLQEVREMAKSAEDRAYIRALREIGTRERDAVAAADTAAYEALQRERADLEASRPRATPAPRVEPPAPATPQPPQRNPTVETWVRANPWFTTDPVLNQVAIAYDAQIKQDNPDWTVEEQLAEVKRIVVARFPEKFPTNTRRAAPPMVATPNNAPARAKGKSVKDLPKEFQDAFAKFQKMMPGYTEEEYLKTLGDM